MARQNNERDTTPILSAASRWIQECLIQDGSVFTPGQSLWTAPIVDEVYHAFVNHPDVSSDDFMTKLKRQLGQNSPAAQRLAAEMLWSLLLFPSNMKARTKRQQISDIWGLADEALPQDHNLLRDDVLVGIGSGGPGFNNYRPNELEFLIAITRDLKGRNLSGRSVLTGYDSFWSWIASVQMDGNRQFRHMLRYFSFPDQVERISSNNDRRKILSAYGAAELREMADWSDRQLDEALLALRARLQAEAPSTILDFYESPWREKWANDRKVRTPEGEVTVTVPGAEEDAEEPQPVSSIGVQTDVRQSFLIQASLVRIGAMMGFKVWLPRADRGRVSELLNVSDRASLLENLPLNYDGTTLDTIELIDVLWLKGRSMARAFEVEHTTAVYSGLLRMADLLALQPNMDIRLHIVASEERRDKVFREMQRPVFSLLERGPLSKSCTFISYESVNIIASMPHLAHMHDSIIHEYEEAPGSN